MNYELRDINNYFILNKENGISCEERKIYELLYALGYRKKYKRDSYYHIENPLKEIFIQDIKDLFLNLLRDNYFENYPNDFDSEKVLNWIFSKDCKKHRSFPIVNNGLFRKIMEDGNI